MTNKIGLSPSTMAALPTYYQMTAFEAVNISANDWWGLKHPVEWAPLERVSVWDLEY